MAGGDAVALSFKLRGLSLEPLAQSKPLMKAVKKALRSAIAQECGDGVGAEHVAVSLSEGSVIVDANVWPPAETSCPFVKDRLKASLTLLETIETWVSEVPNLEKLLTSPVRVSRSSVSVSIIREEEVTEGQPAAATGAEEAMATARRLLEQEQRVVMMKCKEMQDCLIEAEQDVTALKSELELVKSRQEDGSRGRLEQAWSRLVALVAWHWLPLADWSLRVRTVLAGSALASIKFDSEADDIAASTHRKALVGWSWGRLATHLQHRHVVAGHRALLVAKEVFRRTLMAWARLVSAASRDQAERASWVIQAWARLASMLELVDVRRQDCPRGEEVLSLWPHVTHSLLLHHSALGWHAAMRRAYRLQAAVRAWRCMAWPIRATLMKRPLKEGQREAQKSGSLRLSWARLSRRLCAVDAERRAVVLRRWGRFTWTSSSKVAAGPSQWQWLSELLLARHQSQGYREGIRHTSTLHRVLSRWRRLVRTPEQKLTTKPCDRWAHFLAMVHWWLHDFWWRVRAVLAGSELAMLKQEGQGQGAMAATWGRFAQLLPRLESEAALLIAVRCGMRRRRVLAAWTRLLQESWKGHFERHFFALQSWSRRLALIRGHQRSERSLERWPTVAVVLLTWAELRQWRAATARGTRLRRALGSWQSMARRLGEAQAEEQRRGVESTVESKLKVAGRTAARGSATLVTAPESATLETAAPESPTLETAAPESPTPDRVDLLFKWINLTMSLLEPSNVLREIGLLMRQKHGQMQQQVKQGQGEIKDLHEALRKQSSHAILAHQLLFQESKRTLAHCKRFQHHLVPAGLEDQCQEALARCQQLLDSQ